MAQKEEYKKLSEQEKMRVLKQFAKLNKELEVLKSHQILKKSGLVR